MMTEDLMGPPRMYVLTPWVRRLLVANLIVFLFQVTLFTLQSSAKTFGFIPLLAAQRPWTFLTYMFLHGSALHLTFNLLALFMFGGPVEDRLGSRAFIWFYLLCGVAGIVISRLEAFTADPKQEGCSALPFSPPQSGRHRETSHMNPMKGKFHNKSNNQTRAEARLTRKHLHGET